MALSNKKETTTWAMPLVGNVEFRRNRKAKRLSISIRPSTGVRVTIPGYLPLYIAKEFVKSKRSWIVEKLNEQPDITKKLSQYQTRERKLKLIPETTNSVRGYITEEAINIHYPSNLDINDERIQQVALNAIDETFRIEAKKILPTRVDEFARKHGFNYNNLRLKRITSRWGSCSSKNNINLSIYLMKLPDELIDYVILHELCHTVHKNHGPNFWNLLNKLTGNAKGLASRMRKYRTGV
ncbi:MAG: M48 family metallopeptidase [Bacteroidales bacterium]